MPGRRNGVVLGMVPSTHCFPRATGGYPTELLEGPATGFAQQARSNSALRSYTSHHAHRPCFGAMPRYARVRGGRHGGDPWMACKGSGVQIPSAPPGTTRGGGGESRGCRVGEHRAGQVRMTPSTTWMRRPPAAQLIQTGRLHPGEDAVGADEVSANCTPSRSLSAWATAVDGVDPNIEVGLTRWLCCRSMVGFPAVLA
jgi:hypothetical protein